MIYYKSINSRYKQADMAPSNDGILSNGVHQDLNGVQANGAPQTNGSTSTNPYSIPMNDEYAYTPRRLRVVTIGAGFSGLMIAHKFQHRFPEMQDILDHTIYEGHSELGGTWLVNTYPGVQLVYARHRFG